NKPTTSRPRLNSRGRSRESKGNCARLTPPRLLRTIFSGLPVCNSSMLRVPGIWQRQNNSCVFEVSYSRTVYRTFQVLAFRTPLTHVSALCWRAMTAEKEGMVRPERFELPTCCSGGNRSIQLSYGRTDHYSLHG